MAPATSPQHTLHELSKWLVVLGLALTCAMAAVHMAERTAESRHTILIERSARYRQTEYASRYQSHAHRAEERLGQINTLVRIFGSPVPGTMVLLLGTVVFGLTSRNTKTVRKVKTRKRPRGRKKPGKPRSRPAGTQSRN